MIKSNFEVAMTLNLNVHSKDTIDHKQNMVFDYRKCFISVGGLLHVSPSQYVTECRITEADKVLLTHAEWRNYLDDCAEACTDACPPWRKRGKVLGRGRAAEDSDGWDWGIEEKGIWGREKKPKQGHGWKMAGLFRLPNSNEVEELGDQDFIEQ